MSANYMFYPKSKKFSNAEERAFAREELVYNVTEDILIALEDLDISKKELARRLGKSRSYVTQILSGARNMTLGSLSDICFAIDLKPRVKFTTHKDFVEIEDIQWISEDSEEVNDNLVRKSENIIDCLDQTEWETQAA